MELANFWAWFSGKSSRRSAKRRTQRGRTRCTPHLQTLEDRSLLNGYIAVGAGAGAPPLVTIRVDKVDALNGSPPNNAGQPPVPGSDGRTDFTSQTLAVYDSRFTGGVRVASGNFDGFTDDNGDGVDDRPDYVVTAPGAGGGPHIKIWEMTEDVAGNITFRRMVHEFMAYDTRFVGGVNLAVGDLDGDGRAELITGAGPGGGPHVKIFKFDFSDQRMVMVNQFMAYDPRFRGGVSVASNMGYQVRTQYRQFVGALHPDGFDEVPYDPPESRPGFNADPFLDIPLSGTTLEPTTLTFQGFFTIASGPVQYVGGNLLNSYGNLAYEPNVFDPTGNNNIPPEQPLVYATWADTDTNIPPFAVPDVVYGPLVQLFPAGFVADEAVVQPFSAASGQVNARNQLVTGPGPGGGPVVRVWDFVNDDGGFRLNEQIEFMAFDPNSRTGINVSIGDFVELPEPEPFVPIVRPDNGGLTSTQIQFPYSTNTYRQYGAEIMVSTASGGFQTVMFSDYNPIDPFTGRPSRRTNLQELNLVPTFVDTIVVPDPTNPLGGFFSTQDVTLFGNAIDPQFRGQIFAAASALTFDGTPANTRAQNVFGAGANPNNLPLRGPLVRIFDDLGALPVPPPGPLATPRNTPVDHFAAFLQGHFPNGIGGVSFGFGTLPMPGLRVINLSPLTTVTTVNNPIFVEPDPPAG